MGFATNILLFFAVFSLIVTTAGNGVGNKSTTLNAFMQAFTTGSLPSDFNLVQATTDAGIFAAAVALIGTIVFPNPYVIFGAFCAGLMASWMTFPYQLFSSSIIPPFISTLFTQLFGLSIALGIIYWFKGGTGEL